VQVTTLAGGALLPVTDIKLWLKADEGVAKNYANVWTDSSGTQRDAFQLTPASQPLVVENAINGRPVVRFDGANDTLNISNFANGSTQGEVFIVAKASATQVDVSTLWTMGDDYIWGPNTYPGGDGTVVETFGTRNQKNTGRPPRPLNETHLYNVSSKAGEFVTRFNGSQHYRTASNTVFFPGTAILGGGLYERHRYGGDIAELIVFNRVLSQTERDRVESYLADKYLIASFDLDGDGLTNAEEETLGTDPRNADTNGDGISDGASVHLGIDPLGPGYNWLPSPQPPSSTPLNFTLTDPPGAVLLQ
jgi:Bacterial TSP3 repeat